MATPPFVSSPRCSLNSQQLPHNPLVNAGAIAVCSLILPDKEPAARFEHLKSFLERMSGHRGAIGFDNGSVAAIGTVL